MSDSKWCLDASVSDLLALPYVKEKTEKIFLRVPASLKHQWMQMCLDRRTKQTQAGDAIVAWIIAQPAEVQSAIINGAGSLSVSVVPNARNVRIDPPAEDLTKLGSTSTREQNAKPFQRKTGGKR